MMMRIEESIYLYKKRKRGGGFFKERDDNQCTEREIAGRLRFLQKLQGATAYLFLGRRPLSELAAMERGKVVISVPLTWLSMRTGGISLQLCLVICLMESGLNFCELIKCFHMIWMDIVGLQRD